MDPVVKRYLLGIPVETITEVFGATAAQVSKAVHDHCKTANPEAYKALSEGKRKPDIRTLAKHREDFT